MTQISYTRYHDEHIIECIGHAESSPFGEAILCSAVSVLCLTAREYLEKASAEGLIRNLYCNFEPGKVFITFTCSEGSDAEKCIETIICGFKMLGESFPDNIDLDI
ncbi:MAG: ribosomal-processing cysteine protease Prp [Clostridia bacterium]|nr:ribosomal-processing cysteine protease Prp [Clostridia bacterium]